MASPAINPAIAAPPPGVVFDSAPVPASSPAQASTTATSAPPPGVVFDSTPVPGEPSQPTQTQPSTPIPDALHIDPNGNVFLNAAKRVNSIGAGIGDGVLDTLNGGASILGLPHATLQTRQQELEQQNRENPSLNTTGKLTENVAEFLGGDGALKALALSDRLLKVSRIAKVLEGSPLAMRAFNIGVDALRSGVAQGAITTAKTGGDVTAGLEQGTVGGGITAAIGAASPTLAAISNALDVHSIQAPLQQTIKDTLSDVATKFGVDAPTASSIRDTAQQVSDSIKARASAMYSKLDEISGGQAQRFRDAAQNVSDKLHETVGLDDEQEAKLVAQQAKIEAAHQQMLSDLEAKGYDRNMLQQADAVWKQQAALSDLSNSIRQSTGGLRPDMANGVTGATSPEAVNPKTLFTKLNRLNDRGRLAQAIGPDNATKILQTVDQAYLSAQKIAARSKWAALALKAGRAVGLGGLGYEGVKITHDLLGDQQ